MDCKGRECPHVHNSDGACGGAAQYREPTIAELNSTDPKTPHRHVRPVRVTCPTGRVLDAKVRFEGGEDLKNVLRAVVALEPPDREGKGGTALIFLTRFNNEIGKVVYEVADCLLGEAPIHDIKV